MFMNCVMVVWVLRFCVRLFGCVDIVVFCMDFGVVMSCNLI